ncbi:hypothetical protein B0H14DRAFT_3469027 [Mycena olivaceomarginata]|nr:hypothetical protein B0H14DRAFT_3469027 [Mycena olivaceomarginata]
MPPTHKRKPSRIDSDAEEDFENSVHSDSRSSSRSPSPELREDPPACRAIQVREQQKKANDAKKKLRAAERRLADITNQDDTAPKRGRKKRKVLAGGSEVETKEIKHLAHKFYNPLKRFENRGSKIQGELADLLDILPAKFHGDVMRSDWLIKLFNSEMGTQRSNSAGRVRPQCGTEIFDCTAADLATPESRRDKFRTSIGYVEDADGSHYEVFKVEILHKNYNGSLDVDTVFRGPKLHLVFACVTRGPAAGKAMKITGTPTQATGKCVAQLWGLRHSTPGSIAACAMLAHWAVSADIELTPCGAETGINWQADLEKYIKYLQNGLDKRKASVLRIFREWDEIFFPDTNSSLGANGKANGNGGGNAEKQMQDAMDLLNADEEEVPAEAA